MASLRKKHSSLSPIVVACCKSKTSTNRAKYGKFLIIEKRKRRNLPLTSNLIKIYWGSFFSFYTGAGTKPNQLSLFFEEPQKKNLVTSLFFQKASA
jgi:hypothetical protein